MALKLGVKASSVRNVIIWGNHSSTQFPDVSHATVCRGTDCQQVYAAVNDDAWLKGDFIKVIMMMFYVLVDESCDLTDSTKSWGSNIEGS